MKSHPLFAVTSVLLMAYLMAAGQEAPAKVRRSELSHKAFAAGPLKITFKKFTGSVFTSSEVRNTGIGYIEVEVENTSAEFANFDPQRLSFVDRDDIQADVLALRHYSDVYAAEDRRVAPGARIKQNYNLTDKLNYPVRIYYEDKLLGTIVE